MLGEHGKSCCIRSITCCETETPTLRPSMGLSLPALEQGAPCPKHLSSAQGQGITCPRAQGAPCLPPLPPTHRRIPCCSCCRSSRGVCARGCSSCSSSSRSSMSPPPRTHLGGLWVPDDQHLALLLELLQVLRCAAVRLAQHRGQRGPPWCARTCVCVCVCANVRVCVCARACVCARV